MSTGPVQPALPRACKSGLASGLSISIPFLFPPLPSWRTGRASLPPAVSGVSFNTASNHHLLFTGCLSLTASLVISGSLHLSHARTHEWEKGFSPSQFLPHPPALPKTDPNQLESRKQEVRMYRAEDTTSLLNKSNHITASSEQENTWRANRREVDEISKYQRIKIPLPHQTEPSQSARTGTPEITGGFNMPAIQ